MKMPRKPPDLNGIIKKVAKTGGFERLQKVLGIGYDVPTTRKYLHWDVLRHLKAPEGYSHEEWWAALKLRRQGQAKRVPLIDQQGNPFTYSTVDPIGETSTTSSRSCRRPSLPASLKGRQRRASLPRR
jgi:hypothetical protein